MLELAKQTQFHSAMYDENATNKHAALKILVQLSNALLLLNGQQLCTQQKFDIIANCMKQQKEFKQMEKEIEFMAVEINSGQIDMLVLQQHLNKLLSILGTYDIRLIYVEGRVVNDPVFTDLAKINESLNDWCQDYSSQLQFIAQADLASVLDDDISEDEPLIFHVCRLNIEDPAYFSKATKLFDELVSDIEYSTVYLSENDIFQRIHDTLSKVSVPIRYWNTMQIWLDFHKLKTKPSKWTTFVKSHKLYRDGHGILTNYHTLTKFTELNQIGENVLLKAITERCNEAQLFDLSIDTNTCQCCIVLTIAF